MFLFLSFSISSESYKYMYSFLSKKIKTICLIFDQIYLSLFLLDLEERYVLLKLYNPHLLKEKFKSNDEFYYLIVSPGLSFSFL